MSSDWIGRELGGYRIIEDLGQGNMAEVFKAVQTSVEREVAVKIMFASLANNEQFVARFRQEARLIAALEHPYILPVIDFGEQKGTFYLVTRYVNGGTLEDLIDQSPLSPQQALRYLSEIGEALDYAHAQGIIHRDIKPRNVLLDAQGNPFVADFGLAKLLAATGLTDTGVSMIGTPHYMSPEQGLGQPADGRSDIYSLGIVFYEMLTGERPYDADSAVGIVMKHINEPVPSFATKRPDLAPLLDFTLTRALAKDPTDRYPTAHEFVVEVARALAPLFAPKETPAPLPPAKPEQLRSAVRSLPTAWILGFIVVAFIGFVVLSGIGKPATPQATTTPAPPTPTHLATPTPIPHLPTATLAPSLTTPIPLAGQRLISSKDGMTLLYVPAGDFLLGSADTDPDAREDEKPQQTIYLDAFWMDRTEVTVAQFRKFAETSGYVTDAEREGGGLVYSPNEVNVKSAYWQLPQGSGAPEATGRQPVTQVTWNDAKTYCEWAGRRLPTESEWDKAARGSQGSLYPWGNTFDPARLNFCDRSCGAPWRLTAYDDTFSRVSSVGLYPSGASPYNLLDVAGNVWEWVNDYYDFRGYYRFPTANPPGLEIGDQRVARGGSWIDTPDRLRASARLPLNPRVRSNVTGFRCAVSATKIK
jgi:serine/threonine-protein kinase